MRYKIRHHTEEFDCPQCGAPLYVGDTAWQDDADTAPFCSAYCAGAVPAVAPATSADAAEYCEHCGIDGRCVVCR